MIEIGIVVGVLVVFGMAAHWLAWIVDVLVKDRDRWSDQWKLKQEELMHERYRVIALECELEDLRRDLLVMAGRKSRTSGDGD